MAAQPSSASLTATASALSQSAFANSGNGNSGVQGLNPSSSLPFSFLVTFLAIFLFFLGCGLGSRRVTRTLRRNLGLEVTGLEGGRRVSRGVREKPLLWDVFPRGAPSAVGGKDSGRGFSHSWEVMAPLCATHVRISTPAGREDPLLIPAPSAVPQSEPQTVNSFRWPLGGTGYMSSRGVMRLIPRVPPPTPSRTPNAPRRPAPEMHWRGRRVPDWIARPLMPDPLDGPQTGLGFDPAVRSDSEETAEEGMEVQALQMVVLVSMPSLERAYASRLRNKVEAEEAERRESGNRGKARVAVEDTIEEYVLGSSRVPWTDGEIGGSM